MIRIYLLLGVRARIKKTVKGGLNELSRSINDYKKR